MKRPTSWAPLAESDPLPGDPDRIETEATRLRNLAVEMRSQVSRLRQVANENENVGDFSVKLREAAGDLAGKLEKVIGRYEQVSGHLRGWAPDLRYAQEESVKALTKAQEAERTRDANTTISAVPSPNDPPPTPAEEAAERTRQQALSGASEELRQAREQLGNAMEHAQSRGSHWAGKIEDSIEDEVEDSWWDNVKDFVDRNAGWIKVVTDILSYVATGLAVLAIFIPGVNLIVWGAIGLTALVLASHTLLASTGNGSWADVALDVFALATFGAGKIITSGIKGASAATRTAAVTSARGTAKGSSLAASRTSRTAAGRVLSNPTSSAAARRGARGTIDAAKREANRAGTRAAREVRQTPIPTPSKVGGLRAGDYEATQHASDALRWRARFPDDAAVQQASRGVSTRQNVGAATFGAGAAADLGDKGATLAPGEGYESGKDHFTKEVGSTW